MPEERQGEISVIREKLDPTQMLRLQIERCQDKMANSTTEDFMNAVEGLLIYCTAIKDEDFFDRVETIKGCIHPKIEASRKTDGSVEYKKYDEVYFKSYKKIFSLAIDLINKRGMMFRREIYDLVGKKQEDMGVGENGKSLLVGWDSSPHKDKSSQEE